MKKPNNLYRIIQILNDGQYHDGNTMGRLLNLTRSGVWKNIQKIKKYGIAIHSVKNKGHALVAPLFLLDAERIQKNISHHIQLEIYETIPSTNEYLKGIQHETLPIVCMAEHQSQGKGRLGRKWHSPFGENIYFSCRVSFKKELFELAGLSLVTALTVLNSLKRQGIHEHLYLKWPNDIYYGHQKISGILHELFFESHHRFSQAIIGIGINVNSLQDHNKIGQAWTSLQKILHRPIDRNEMVIDLINHLLHDLKQFEEAGLQPFIKDWAQYDYFMGREVTVTNATQSFRGHACGINAQGQFMLALPNGEKKAFSSGTVCRVDQALL